MTKPALFLLPGLMCDARMWTPQIAAFEEHHDIQVADFRAFDRFGAMAQSVLDSAPERFALAGHSMGARVAMMIAAMAPERVERLALFDTAAHPPAPHEKDSRGALVALGYAEGMEAVANAWLPPMLHPDHRGDHPVHRELRQMVLDMTPEIYDRQTQALLHRPDARPGLMDIGCPTLIGVGRQDEWSPVSRHEELAALITGSVLTIFEQSGHMAPREAPEAVTAAMRDWLAA